ncbi:hypothetical protein M231_01562 [Tremella mesenterica]|uniref:Uncharacterized protein n=1 Tax=Tremella mesenterica TaxID=5217 RepID=A0A4Q1BT52_TREME|nr:hypothetical protein M231_01562 [Tremella mesenterica]
MWKKWEATEAPLRQGRGWYPALDRHFLELLVISEIACLAHPLHGLGPPGQAERIHRHASRVRRVACERIGAERLHAYCERVKEAFDAYMQGGWRAPDISNPPAKNGNGVPVEGEASDDFSDSDSDDDTGVGPNELDRLDESNEDEEERGRQLQRIGNGVRAASPTGVKREDVAMENDNQPDGPVNNEMQVEVKLDIEEKDQEQELDARMVGTLNLTGEVKPVEQKDINPPAAEMDLDFDTRAGMRDAIVVAALKKARMAENNVPVL